MELMDKYVWIFKIDSVEPSYGKMFWVVLSVNFMATYRLIGWKIFAVCVTGSNDGDVTSSRKEVAGCKKLDSIGHSMEPTYRIIRRRSL